MQASAIQAQTEPFQLAQQHSIELSETPGHGEKWAHRALCFLPHPAMPAHGPACRVSLAFIISETCRQGTKGCGLAVGLNRTS